MQLWRVQTLKATDDRNDYVARSIDHIIEDLDDALAEAKKRLEGDTALEVSISKEEMTERYREMLESPLWKKS